MYARQTVPLSEAMRAELERLARGPGNRWLLMARYAVKSGAYVGLGMCALVLLVYGLAQVLEYLFPSSAFCRRFGSATPKFSVAIPFAAIAALGAAWISRFEWQSRIKMADTAQRDLQAGVCDQVTFELTSRHVLAFDECTCFLFVPMSDNRTFVFAADQSDPRTQILTDAQGETCGSMWRWYSALNSDVVTNLTIEGAPVALKEGVWMEASALYDKFEDVPTDGEVLDLPFERVEQLANEEWQPDNASQAPPVRSLPSSA